MPIELYHFDPSPPCRMVRLLAEHLGVELELKEVDITKGEQLEADYIQNFYFVSKLNPQHTIPTMVDNGVTITESRAMLMYIANVANANGEGNETLYPADPEKRVLIDMRICFDLATLYVRFSETYFPVMFRKVPPSPDNLQKLDTALGHVENFLTEGDFIAGNDLTIADFSMSVILSTLDACGHDLSNFPEIGRYLEKCAEEMKGWEEINMKGATMLGQWVKAALFDAEA